MRQSVGFLLGAAVWFPAFALVVIRNNGLQAAPVLAGVLVLLFALGREGLRFNKKLLLATCLWLIVLIVSTLLSPHRDQALRGGVLLLSGFGVLYAAYFLGRSAQGRTSFLRGFTAGGLLSAFYAGYQVLAFRGGWPGGTLLNNNPSFPSYAQSQWLEALDRAFAFTPEPSVLSSLLIPLFLIYAVRCLSAENRTRSFFVLVVSFFGLVASSSLALVVTFPLALLLLFMLNSQFRAKISGHKLILLLLSLSCVILLLFLNDPQSDWTLTKRVQEGVAMIAEGDTLEAGSFLVRFFAGLAALQLFFERPVFGWGLFATSPEFEEKLPVLITAFEQKTGADSWILAFAMWQGFVGLLVLGFLFYLSLRAAKTSPPLQAALLGVVVTIALQTGYLLLYHVWAFLGLALAARQPSRVESLDAVPR